MQMVKPLAPVKPNVHIRLDPKWQKKVTPEALLGQIQALETAGLRVNLQVQEAEGLAFLQQLPAVKQAVPRQQLGLPWLLLGGILASGTMIVSGVAGLVWWL